jgi:hypothetical protein
MRLTQAGRKFVFSAIHERFRVANLDEAKAKLGIFQFDNTKGGGRILRLHVHDDETPLFEYPELETMTAETYSIWAAVLAERDEELRRAAGDDLGPLFKKP